MTVGSEGLGGKSPLNSRYRWGGGEGEGYVSVCCLGPIPECFFLCFGLL